MTELKENLKLLWFPTECLYQFGLVHLKMTKQNSYLHRMETYSCFNKGCSKGSLKGLSDSTAVFKDTVPRGILYSYLPNTLRFHGQDSSQRSPNLPCPQSSKMEGLGKKGKCIPVTLFTFGIYLLFICFLELESLLCSSGCSGTHRDPVASASSVLGLKPCVIMASPIGFLKGLLASSNRITPHLNAKWPQGQKRNGRKENKYNQYFLPCIILKLKDRKMFNSKYPHVV